MNRTPWGKQRRADLRPIEDESFRWLKGYREACVLASQCPQTQIVMVADSEADIYDIFQAAQDQSHPRADYLIRAHERSQHAGSQPGNECTHVSQGS
ncbi:MAG: hypothetical protein U0941_18370 [Planctomycetaceae bacterium]